MTMPRGLQQRVHVSLAAYPGLVYHEAMKQASLAPPTEPLLGSLSAAAMGFMREHGILKDIYKKSSSTSHRTTRGRNVTHRTSKGPGSVPRASCATSCHALHF